MGATLPLLSRVVAGIGEGRKSADRLATLYAMNTAGGAAGALLGAYAILPLLGVRGADEGRRARQRGHRHDRVLRRPREQRRDRHEGCGRAPRRDRAARGLARRAPRRWTGVAAARAGLRLGLPGVRGRGGGNTPARAAHRQQRVCVRPDAGRVPGVPRRGRGARAGLRPEARRGRARARPRGGGAQHGPDAAALGPAPAALHLRRQARDLVGRARGDPGPRGVRDPGAAHAVDGQHLPALARARGLARRRGRARRRPDRDQHAGHHRRLDPHRLRALAGAGIAGRAAARRRRVRARREALATRSLREDEARGAARCTPPPEQCWSS